MADTPDLPNETDQAKAEAAKTARRWIAELGVSEKAQSRWLIRARKIVKRYKRLGLDSDVLNGGGERQFALLWANTETIRPAVYARPPQPVVGRRFKDADPVGRQASEVLERGLSYSIDKQDLDGTLRTATLDYVLIARGQAWERYVPTHGPQVIPQITLQLTTDAETGKSGYLDEEGEPYEGEVTQDGEAFFGQGEPYEPVVFEESITDYVNWEDFGSSASRTWDEVTYVWRRVYMDREALIKRFGEQLGKLIPLDWGPVEQRGLDTRDSLLKRAAVYEIWDKCERKVFWISKSWGSRPLDERDDPLGLDGFFPCPRPLLGTVANDSLIPVPDYVFWQDQAEEIDDLTNRIGQLQDALKVRGFYAGDVKQNLNNLLNSKNNTLIPVPEWQSLKDGGGVKGKIEWMPIDLVMVALKGCIELRAQLIEDVYQITGVADILRGSSDPRETATAAALKGQWGPLRIRDRQNEMARFARDILRIKAEVIAEKFSQETLSAMTGLKMPTRAEQEALKAQLAQAQAQAAQTGQPLPPIPPEAEAAMSGPTWDDVIALLRDNAMRQFRVDVETDSTIEPNESEEKAQTVELVTALGSLVSQWGPAVAAQPALAPVAAEVIKYALRRFRAGRQMEDVVDAALDKIAATPPPQAPAEQPDTTAIQVAQIDQQTAQMEQQAEDGRAQLQAQIDMQELQLKRGDQELKLVAINRDPKPQATA